MPGEDGTGPLGPCERGLGFGREFGRGLGPCGRYLDLEKELAELEAEKTEIEKRLKRTK